MRKFLDEIRKKAREWWPTVEPAVVAACLLAALMLGAGCAQMFTAKTTAYYKIAPDGTKEVHYSSDKEQVGLRVDLDEEGGKIKSLRISVDKSSTQESVIAATLEVQKKVLDLVDTLTKAGLAAATKNPAAIK